MANQVQCQHPSCHCLFQREDSMLQHFKDCHDVQEVRYACDRCGKSFRKAVGLKDHMRTVHSIAHADIVDGEGEEGKSDQNAVAPAVLPQPSSTQDVACNDCGNTFKSVDALHQHQWAVTRHTRVAKSPRPNRGTRIRACSECDVELPSAEDLDQHYVEHHPICELLKSSEAGTWQYVVARFRSDWIKPTIKLDEVHHILKVYNPGWRRKQFEEYRKELKKDMSSLNLEKQDDPELCKQVLHDGNELHRYHGTTVKCRLGQPSEPGKDGGNALSLCSDNDCSMCRILQMGFKRSKCRENKFQRFGHGIYCSAASSKSAAYVKCNNNAHTSKKTNGIFSCFRGICFGEKKKYKVMMICRVLAGVPYRSASNLRHLQGPPNGYHSVQGVPGEILNYEELVVYDDRAILPAYIILYTSSD